MQNMQLGQFSFELFKKAYDSDPKLQELVADFNKEGLVLKTSEMDDLPQQQKKSGNSVSKMAKRAVSL